MGNVRSLVAVHSLPLLGPPGYCTIAVVWKCGGGPEKEEKVQLVVGV